MIEKANQTQSWSQISASRKRSPGFLKPLSSASCKEEPLEGKDPDCSQTLVTAVSPDLPACRVCLPGRVAWGSLHHACCRWRISFLLCRRWHSLWESTYVQDHWFPAHSAPCSCRMGIFVKRWSSFYACHWMTVKEKRHGAKTGDV